MNYKGILIYKYNAYNLNLHTLNTNNILKNAIFNYQSVSFKQI